MKNGSNPCSKRNAEFVIAQNKCPRKGLKFSTKLPRLVQRGIPYQTLKWTRQACITSASGGIIGWSPKLNLGKVEGKGKLSKCPPRICHIFLIIYIPQNRIDKTGEVIFLYVTSAEKAELRQQYTCTFWYKGLSVPTINKNIRRFFHSRKSGQTHPLFK